MRIFFNIRLNVEIQSVKKWQIQNLQSYPSGKPGNQNLPTQSKLNNNTISKQQLRI